MLPAYYNSVGAFRPQVIERQGIIVAGFCGGNAARIISGINFSLLLILLGVIIVICCVPVWMWLTLLGIALIVFGIVLVRG